MIPAVQSCYKVLAGSHPGKRGKNNEDQFAISTYQLSATNTQPSLFAMVADGIGGHKAGDVASEIAAEMIPQAVAESDASQPNAIMQAAILQASQAILAKSNQDEDKKGMGTTCVCAWVIGDRLYTAAVGDSRLYLLRDGWMYQMTEDHTWVQEAVEAGALTPEQARNHPHANIIRRYLGSPQPLEVDLRIRTDKHPTPSEKHQGMRLRPGDRLILCSDGLSDMVQDDDIVRIASAEDLDSVVPNLIDEANNNGGKDNITVVVIEIIESPGRLASVGVKLGGMKSGKALSYVGLALIAAIILSALVLFAWQNYFTGPRPTPTAFPSPTIILQTPSP
jgi:protein phosphatase